MFRTRFLRNSFFLTLILVILLPIHATQVTYPSFRDLLIMFTEENAVRVANYMADAVVVAGEKGNQTHLVLTVTSEFKTSMATIAKAFNLYKYRLFDVNGRIVHSSAADEEGKINELTYFHDVVAKGNNYSLVVQKDHKTLENEVFKRDVVETYVPIMRAGQFQGAFEIYFDITDWRKKLDWMVTQASLVLLVMAALFFLVVLTTRFHVMRRVGEFMQAIAETSMGDFHRRIVIAGRDELTDMASGFNRMSEELHKLHQGLQNEKNKLTTIILSAREAIVVTDSEGHVVLVNPAAEVLLGKKEEQIRQEGFLNLVDDVEFVSNFLKREGVDMPETLVFNQHVLHFYASTIRDKQGVKVGSAALIRDVTEEKNLEEKLRNLSVTDALTGLYNRRHAIDVLHNEVYRHQRAGIGFAFILLDVDHFKRFNDQYGHDQGDRVLQAVGQALRDHFRKIDACCRYGGEEFCVILPGASYPGADEAAQRLRLRIEDMVVDGLKVTVSIGVAMFPLSASNHEELVKRADQALYEAKRKGRNQVVTFQEGMTVN